MSQDRRHLAEELDELKTRLLTMGGLAEERLRVADAGPRRAGPRAPVDVIGGDSRIDDLQIEIDERCFTLIALYQPVAIDLRTVSQRSRSTPTWSASEISPSTSPRSRSATSSSAGQAADRLPRMGELALTMLREALDAFVRET